MQIVERRNQSAALPLAAIAAILAVLVMGLAVWSASHRPAGSTLQAPSVVLAAGSLSPDAQERNALIRAAQLGRAEGSHGH